MELIGYHLSTSIEVFMLVGTLIDLGAQEDEYSNSCHVLQKVITKRPARLHS